MKIISRLMGRWGSFVLALFFCSPVFGHKASDSYLTLRAGEKQFTGEWHLALRDLDFAIGLDMNDDGVITWQELRAREPAVRAYALSHLHVGTDQYSGQLHLTQLLVENHSDGAYAVLQFVVEELPRNSNLEIEYQAFFDGDRLHRGLLKLVDKGQVRLAVFSPDSARQRFQLAVDSEQALSAGCRLGRPDPLAFVREGVWHIWTGYDHILFLVALLLPGALRRGEGAWLAQERIRPILGEVFSTVTAFTVAHSMTLSLAALGLVHLPSRLVESVIAGSIVLAALNNVLPVLCGRAWLIAFGFGLLHGFGFANALVDLGLRGRSVVPALFGFNVGVEAGQLAIVGVLLPTLLFLRHRVVYRRFILPIGSVAIALLAAAWVLERVSS